MTFLKKNQAWLLFLRILSMALFMTSHAKAEFHPEDESLSRHWSDQSTTHAIKVHSEIIDKHFIFRFSGNQPLRTNPKAKPGNFFEGLWENDCVEIFLVGPSGRYLEINAASNTAFWTCWFSEPLVREKRAPIKPKVSFQQNGNDWVIRIQLALKDIANLGPLEQVRWNATAIVNSPHYQYLSACPLPGERPNFHQPKYFTLKLKH